MIGNIKWNLIFGICGAIFTFLINISSNLFTTTLIRCGYVFVSFFLLGFAVRFLLGVVLRSDTSNNAVTSDDHEGDKGLHVDLSTPEENHPIQESKKEDEFKALQYEKLTKEEPQAEDVVKAVRQLNEQDV